MRSTLNTRRNRLAIRLSNFILNKIGTPDLARTLDGLIQRGMEHYDRAKQQPERVAVFEAYWSHEITAQECARRLAALG